MVRGPQAVVKGAGSGTAIRKGMGAPPNHNSEGAQLSLEHNFYCIAAMEFAAKVSRRHLLVFHRMDGLGGHTLSYVLPGVLQALPHGCKS